MAARFADVVNVKDYGAVGDGVTDDTTAIQAALTAAGSNRTVFLGGAQYRVSQVIISGVSGLTIDGGGGMLIGLASGTYTSVLLITNSTNIRVRNLTIHGAYNANYGAGALVTGGAGGTSRAYFSQVDVIGARRGWRFGDEADVDKQCSEISIVGGSTYGTPTVIEAAGTQTVASFHGTQIISDWNGWPDQTLPAYVVLAKGAYVSMVGGEATITGTTGWTAFQSQPIASVTYGNQYGAIVANGTQIESASQIATTANPGALAAPVGGMIAIHRGFGYHAANAFPFAQTDATFPGRIEILDSNFYAGVARTQPNIQAGSTSTTIVTDETSFGTNFLVATNPNAFVSGKLYLRRTARGPGGLAPSVSADRGDASQTLAVGTDAPIQRWATALTANRTVTLSTTGAVNGDTFRVVRTGLGAFTLDVGGLKTIPAGTAAFVDVSYNGSAWVLAGYGAL